MRAVKSPDEPAALSQPLPLVVAQVKARPATHLTHSMAPGRCADQPVGQALHDDAWAAGAKVPSAHGRQSDEPVEEYAPALQFTHTESLVPPTAPLAVPDAHFEQVEAAAPE